MKFENYLSKVMYEDYRNKRKKRLPNAKNLERVYYYESEWDNLYDKGYIKYLKAHKCPKYIQKNQDGYMIDLANAGYKHLDKYHKAVINCLAEAVANNLSVHRIETEEDFEIIKQDYLANIEEFMKDEKDCVIELSYDMSESERKKISHACYLGRQILIKYNKEDAKSFNETIADKDLRIQNTDYVVSKLQKEEKMRNRYLKSVNSQRAREKEPFKEYVKSFQEKEEANTELKAEQEQSL